MYNYLKGKITYIDIENNLCVLEVNNIGYEIIVPTYTFEEIHSSDEIKLYVVEVSSGLYSGGTPTLYGFLSQEEKEIFLAFKENLSNVGPKKALEYLEKVKKNINQFKLAIKTRNYKILTSLFGFRQSSAEKIVFSLSNLDAFLNVEEPKQQIHIDAYTDLVSALVNLGYKESDVKSIVEKVLISSKDGLSNKKSSEIIEEFLPKVLQEISGRKINL